MGSDGGHNGSEERRLPIMVEVNLGLRGCFFFQAEDGIRDIGVTGVQTCALPISRCGRSAAVREPTGSKGRRLADGPDRAAPQQEISRDPCSKPGAKMSRYDGRVACIDLPAL